MRAVGRAAAAVACVLGAAAGCNRPPRPPDLGFQWPRAGMTVAPGEELQFRLAIDAPGNHAFQLSRTGAGAVGRAEGAGIATIPWQVPPDAAPGQRIDFTATARNTATNLVGNAATHVVVGRPAEEWHGTWTGAAKGNAYDDEAWVLFDFTIAPDGTVAGKGKGKLFARPVVQGGCTYTHAQTPAEFDVTVSGRREDGQVALRLSGPGRVGRRTITAACGGAGGGAGPETPHDAFGVAAVHTAGLAPRVPIEPGRLHVAATDAASTMQVEYTTTIARGRRR